VLADITGINLLADAMGLNNLFSAFGSLLGPPITGKFQILVDQVSLDKEMNVYSLYLHVYVHFISL
jgi:hypothetical protein